MSDECNHTIHHVDQDGRLQGSWTEERIGRRVRIVCSVCSRFFGYLPGWPSPSTSNDERTESND